MREKEAKCLDRLCRRGVSALGSFFKMATKGNGHASHKSIGALTAEVQGLRRDMEASERRAFAENPEADEKCAVVHRMDEIVNEVGAIKTDIATITDQGQRQQEVTDQVKQWRAMGLGGLGVVGLACTAVSALPARSSGYRGCFTDAIALLALRPFFREPDPKISLKVWLGHWAPTQSRLSSLRELRLR